MLGYPHNPTARLGSQELLDAVMHRSVSNERVIAHDNPYVDLALDGEAPVLLRSPGWRDWGIEFFSFSKGGALVGFRLAFAVGAEPDSGTTPGQSCGRLQSVIGPSAGGHSRLASLRLLACNAPPCLSRASGSRACRTPQPRMVDPNPQRWPSTSWLPLPPELRLQGMTGESLARQFLECSGVALTPGSGFGPAGRDWLRMALVRPVGEPEQAAHRCWMLCRELDSAALPPRSLGPAPLPSDSPVRSEGWQLRWVPVCSSTERLLKQWLHQDPLLQRPRAVVARHQRRAVGQRGREWQAPTGGVWLSAALPVDSVRLDAPGAGLFGLAVALALAERLERAGVAVRIKWPNDLLVEGRKLAGILPALLHRGHELRLLRCGVGLNVCNAVPTGAVALRHVLPAASADVGLRRCCWRWMPRRIGFGIGIAFWFKSGTDFGRIKSTILTVDLPGRFKA